MQAILSIKPEFAEKIFAGLKKYEFRKSIFKNPSVKTIVVYASSPVKMVIGEFEVDYIITSEIPELWELTKAHAGISESFFYKYFENKKCGYAIKIKKTRRYKTPKCIVNDYEMVPPQSFAYIKE